MSSHSPAAGGNRGCYVKEITCGSLGEKNSLPPATIHEDISVMPVTPARGYPHRMLTGRNFPATALPDICVPVPPMVSGHPDMAWARSYDALLVDTNRRPKLYNDLRMSGHHPQCHSKQRGEKYFPHIPSWGCRKQTGCHSPLAGNLT